MPFYRYECDSCKNEFRLLRHSGDEELAECPRCGSRRTNRLLPRIGVIYKGRGYYATDYRRTRTGGGTKGRDDAAPSADEHASGA